MDVPSAQVEDILSVWVCNCVIYDVIESDVVPCMFSRPLLSVDFALFSI